MGLDEDALAALASKQLKRDAVEILALRAHASSRKIYRLIFDDGESVIGIANDSVAENLAFVEFSRSFRSLRLRVPSILAFDGSRHYLETDLGDTTLMNILDANRTVGAPGDAVVDLYRCALTDLVHFQTNGLEVIDRSLCYQGDRFDEIAVHRDLRYFATEYLMRAGIGASGLDDDFQELSKRAGNYERGFFMFRDFQARNIMVVEGVPHYIDYQSGREGPLHYDVASLLFQSQANLPTPLREELLEHYLQELSGRRVIDKDAFRSQYLLFVLVRALQNLGAYGKLGIGQGKQYFLNSIPYALRNCSYVVERWPIGKECGALRARLVEMIQHGQS